MTKTVNNKDQLKKLVKSNIGKYIKITYRNGIPSNYVTAHESHIKSIDIGWIVAVELEADQEKVLNNQKFVKDATKLIKNYKSSRS